MSDTFKVFKANGWNHYVIKKRFLKFFWTSVKPTKIYFSKAVATVDCIELNSIEVE